MAQWRAPPLMLCDERKNLRIYKSGIEGQLRGNTADLHLMGPAGSDELRKRCSACPMLGIPCLNAIAAWWLPTRGGNPYLYAVQGPAAWMPRSRSIRSLLHVIGGYIHGEASAKR